jgi:hypothetical protein
MRTGITEIRGQFCSLHLAFRRKTCLIFSEVETKISEIREFSESSPA